MEGIHAWIAPRNMHGVGSQIDYHRIHGFFPVEWIHILFCMVTDGIRKINVIPLDCLDRLDSVLV